MRDLAQHLLDILENSAMAGASEACVVFRTADNWLTVEITDNGPGFPAAVRDNPGDPWLTTRTTRQVGLGLSLLRTAAEQTGGSLHCENVPPGGARLVASFDVAHLDAKPLGNLAETFLLALLAWPQLNLIVKGFVDSTVTELFNTAMVKAELGEVDPGQPDIRRFLESALDEAFAALRDWSVRHTPGARDSFHHTGGGRPPGSKPDRG